MEEESRRNFLMRYAAMALAALAPNGARTAGDNGKAIGDIADNLEPGKVVYGPPPSPFPTLHPRRPRPPAPVYGPPTPYPTLDSPRPPPPAPVYGPPTPYPTPDPPRPAPVYGPPRVTPDN